MRLFTLLNASNDTFELQGGDALFLYPDGIGYEIETEYAQVENNFFATDSNVKQKYITGTMVFNTEAAYNAFLTFIQDFPLNFGYAQEGDDYKYISCRVSKLVKTEYTKRQEWCRADVDFETLGQWQKAIVATEIEAETGAGKTYPYTYPYTYTRGAAGSVLLENTGHMDAPCVLTIRGPALNPSWILQQGGEFLSSGGVTVNLASDEMLVVDSRLTSLSINKTDWSGELIADVWQQSDMEKDNFAYAPVGDSELVFAQSSGTPDVTVSVIEEVYTI